VHVPLCQARALVETAVRLGTSAVSAHTTNTTQTMKQAVLFSGAILAIIIGVFALAYFTTSSVNAFPFAGEGVVLEHRLSEKILSIRPTTLSALARPIARDGAIDVYVGLANILKTNSTGNTVALSLGAVPLGTRVAVTGNVRIDNRFVARTVVVPD
jgi:hypothetical protein